MTIGGPPTAGQPGPVVATPGPDPRGRRLVPDERLPAWMHRLMRNVDGAPLPAPIRSLTGQAPSHARHSAVLMLFGEGPSGPDLLLTQRSATMRSHPGQPAFPGGATDPGETAVQAALREGFEETGLRPSSVLPAALLPELFLPPSGFVVRPVLAYWREPGAVAPVDPAETAIVARVPVADLVDPVNRGQVRHPSGYVGPAFQVADLLVWGFTAGLVDMLLDLGGWTVPWNREHTFHLPDLG